MQMLGGIGDSKQQAASRQSQKPQQQSSPAQHNEPPMDFDDDNHWMIWAQIAHADVTNIRIEELKEHKNA